jgi:hypothetical protein
MISPGYFNQIFQIELHLPVIIISILEVSLYNILYMKSIDGLYTPVGALETEQLKSNSKIINLCVIFRRWLNSFDASNIGNKFNNPIPIVISLAVVIANGSNLDILQGT